MIIKTSTFNQNEFQDPPEHLYDLIDFDPIFREQDYYKAQFCKYTNRNLPWKTA